MPQIGSDDDHGLEQALRGLTPQAANLNRDQLMFAAGAASTRRVRRAWQGLGTTLGLLAAALTLVLVLRPPQVITETVTRDRYVYIPAPGGAALAEVKPAGVANAVALASSHGRPSERDARLQEMRGVILRWGVEALPKPEAALGASRPEPPPTSASGVRQLLGTEGF